MKVKFSQPNYNIDAKDVLEKVVKPFGKTSGHIIMPKKWLGHKVFVAINGKVGGDGNGVH